jgi:hypothetical protein
MGSKGVYGLVHRGAFFGVIGIIYPDLVLHQRGVRVHDVELVGGRIDAADFVRVVVHELLGAAEHSAREPAQQVPEALPLHDGKYEAD